MNASKYKHLDKQIIKLYVSGVSALAIAKKFDIAENTVNYRLKINGIPKRSISAALTGLPKTIQHKLRLSNNRIVKGVAKGSRNPNWKGGVQDNWSALKNSSAYKQWRLSVYSRDNFTCQLCGYTKGHILMAHHIKHRKTNPELTYTVTNGLTLCKSCHRKVHSKRFMCDSGELLENLNVKTQAISSQARVGTSLKVQRLEDESRTDGNSSTSAAPEREDIVCSL